jgi:branched-chain amino acid transport system substrate-binding protein
LNASGGLLGQKIKWTLKDDESTPAVGVSRANELVAEGVKAHVGGYNSPVVLAYQPVFTRANIVDISVIPKVDEVLTGGGNPLAIKLPSANAMDGEILAKILIDKIHAKKVAFLTQNDVYGENTQLHVENGLKKLGNGQVKVVATEKFPFGNTDFRNTLETIRLSGADAIMVTNSSQEAGMPALLQQIQELDVEIPVLEMIGGIGDITLDVAGKAADGVWSVGVYYPNTKPFSEIPENQKFVEAYIKKFGKSPDHFAAAGYAGTQLWAEAVRRTGTLDRKAVAGTIRGGTFPSIYGEYKIDANGQASGVYVPFQVKDGKRVPFELSGD